MKFTLRAIVGLVVVGGLVGGAAFLGGAFDTTSSPVTQIQPGGTQPGVVAPVPSATPAPVVVPIAPSAGDQQMRDAIGDMNLNGG